MLRRCALLVLIFTIVVSGLDLDKDGYDSDPAQGEFQDCCDSIDDGCYDPYMVNPGAWEIPNNGQADRCIEGIDQLAANLPCDFIIGNLAIVPRGVQIGDRGIYQQFIGPTVDPLDTEPGILAMDMCEFKDDDDDPSWGFARQENLIFALSDETRNGYDIGVVGPDINQASVLSSFGRIQPANGRYFLAISTGLSFSALDSDIENLPDNEQYQTTNTVVQPIPEWTQASPSVGQDFSDESNCSGSIAVDQGYDSILARFSMAQPTNMGAFSFKMIALDTKRGEEQFGSGEEGVTCGEDFSYVIVTKNGTIGVPRGQNIAYDESGWLWSSYNPNYNFFELCNEYGAARPGPGPNTCPKTNYLLELTGIYENEYATAWKAIGTSATPGEPFQLKITTWSSLDNAGDITVLLDDYIPIAEQRTFAPPYGYQFTSDVELQYLRPTVNGIYPAATNSVTLTFSVKNNGPEIAGDLAISFTPPKGTKLKNVLWGTLSLAVPGVPPYENNGFYKYISSSPLAVGQTRTGQIDFEILADHPNDIQFKVSVTCSSIEKIFGNNYQIQQIYIDKPVYF